MITTVELANFKNFRHQKIGLDRLTVFVGPNASGKTSVLEALHLAVRAVVPVTTSRQPDVWQPRPEKRFCGKNHPDWLYTRGGSGDMVITCTSGGGTFSVSATPPAGFPPSQTEFFGQGRWTFGVTPTDDRSLQDALKRARSMVFLHLNSAQLARPAYSDRTPPRVEHDGDGLAPVLAYMALNDPDGFDALVDEMRSLIPQLKRIRFTKSTVVRAERELVRFGDESMERKFNREFQGDALLFDFTNANNVSAFAASEGTLLLLGLLTVLLGPAKPGILLLDDIEHGLHPTAQKALIGALGKLMERFPDLQVVASAHSPYLLDCLQPQQIRLTALGPDGYSVCGRLTDHPQFGKWKDEMAPGELWSLFGEKWVVQAEGAA